MAPLEHITDPTELDGELERVRFEYNTVRLHAGIGYVTPDDEHHGRGGMIRKQRAEGLRAARATRLADWRRQQTDNCTRTTLRWLGVSRPEWSKDPEAPQVPVPA